MLVLEFSVFPPRRPVTLHKPWKKKEKEERKKKGAGGGLAEFSSDDKGFNGQNAAFLRVASHPQKPHLAY